MQGKRGPETLKEQIKTWDLYAITDIEMAKGKTYPEIVGAVLSAGVRVVQLRDKTSPFEDLLEVGPGLVEMAHDHGAVLLVNDNPYLAREIGADGVHVGQSDFPVDIVRAIVGPDKIIGLSTHTRPQAIKAESMDVDYIGLGPIFHTATKELNYYPLGVQMVRFAANKLKIDFVCIGGITLENLPDILAAGARCCAVVSGIMAEDDTVAAARRFRQVFEVYREE